MLQDVGEEPGALPLLSHSLLETWKRRSDRELTLAGYISTGRVQGSIAATADSIFTNELGPDEQEVAKEIFLRLTEPGDNTPDTRRRVPKEELLAIGSSPEQVESVLKF